MSIELENAAREMAKHIYKSENKPETKAEIRICGNNPLVENSKKVQCCECKRDCYYDTNKSINQFISKKAKNICIDCALNNHENDLSSLEIEILNRAKGK